MAFALASYGIFRSLQLAPTKKPTGNIFTSRRHSSRSWWFPTILGNYFIRIFHGVLASRFKASLPGHQDQIGFKRLDGIAHNDLKQNAPLHATLVKHENLVVVSVDIRKAFDSISHKAILGILQRKWVPDLLMGYLGSYLSTNRLQIGNNLTRWSQAIRNVKCPTRSEHDRLVSRGTTVRTVNTQHNRPLSVPVVWKVDRDRSNSGKGQL